MHFTLETDANRYIVTSYGLGWITVNKRELRQSLIVTPEVLVTDWTPHDISDLEISHFEMVSQLAPEIILLGTGNKQRYLHPRLIRPLLVNGVGVEIMDTAAACRTYNITMLEGRKVAAALFMI